MGSITAGYNSVVDATGYISSAYAASVGIDPAGTIGGASTDFGVVEILASTSGIGGVVLSSPAGTPTGIVINGTTYSLTFTGDDGTYYFYDIDPAFTGFTATQAYDWSFGLSLDAQGGSFTLTGGDATFRLGRKLDAQGGSFTLTGGAATFNSGYGFQATGGIFALTGGDALFPVSRALTASGGSFTLTGGSATLNKVRRLVAEGGSFAMTGGDALFRYFKLSAEGGEFTLTGGDATLTPFFKTYYFKGKRAPKTSVVFARSAAVASLARNSASARRSTSSRSRRR